MSPVTTVLPTELSTCTHPAALKARNHLILAAYDQNVHHVAGIALRVGYAARNLVEQRGGDAADLRFGGTASGGACGGRESLVEDVDGDVETALGSARIAKTLIDAEEQTAGNRR